MLKAKESYNTILILSLLLLLAPAIYLSFFAHPIADDYGYTNISLKNTLFSECLNQYLTWNGRYTSNILVLSNPLIIGSLIGYQIIPVLLLILTAASFFVFIRAITDQSISRIHCFIVSLLLTILYNFL